MRDYVDIGSTPYAEDCEQVGTPTYSSFMAKKECELYILQLRQQFGDEPGTARLRIKANPHDFGTYYEVVCYYDDNDEEGMDYAYRLESEGPEHWTPLIKEKLDLYREQEKTGIHVVVM